MSTPSARGSGRVGVRQVAQAAGVSTQTVSRVINDHPNLRPETRRRVLDAMAALGYRVNNAARALGTRTTRTIGLLASDATLFGPSAGIAALEAAARDAGRWIATAYAAAADEASVVAAASHLRDQGVDGIVVLAPHAGTLPTIVRTHADVPVAALHAGPGADAQRRAAALAVAHLAGLGHRRIARVSGPSDWLEAAARDEGVDGAMASAGVTPGPSWVGDWSAASGAALAPEVVDAIVAPNGPTAVAVANDQMALGLIAGLRERGIDVPGVVSVTGFDDNPDAAYYRPALTTVRLDLDGEARRVVAEMIGAQYSPVKPPVLVVRASSASPPA
ncbi:LacI family DNA-binding transcriptional regulator [Microbacterium awajiense]|uniref:LacI family DNA-binding transcriptional regulator n=1 Tax=Microbacterium awajiense TaxID=415214 RepID=A0ABP7AW94_9MICO